MSNRLNFTEDDAWAVLFLAAFPSAFPTTAFDICRAGARDDAGGRLLDAAGTLREAGVIEVTEAGYIVLGPHPFALAIKAIAEQVAAQLAVETAIAARDAFELLAQGGSASSKTSDASAAPFQRSPLQQAPEH